MTDSTTIDYGMAAIRYLKEEYNVEFTDALPTIMIADAIDRFGRMYEERMRAIELQLDRIAVSQFTLDESVTETHKSISSMNSGLGEIADALRNFTSPAIVEIADAIAEKDDG